MGKIDDDLCRQMFAARLREARKSKGLTQRQAAAEFGTAEEVWSRYENGHHLPTIPMLYRISKFLECPTDWLLGLQQDRRN